MPTGQLKSIKSKYKHVQGIGRIGSNIIKWVLTIKGVSRKGFNTEKEAGLMADKYLISKGREPVNILKKK